MWRGSKRIIRPRVATRGTKKGFQKAVPHPSRDRKGAVFTLMDPARMDLLKHLLRKERISGMYLPEVQKAEDAPYGETIRQCREHGMPAPELAHLLAYKADRNKFLSLFTHEVMRGPSPLSPGQRELIAAFVSRRNECRY
jgi:hypothetical protein